MTCKRCGDEMDSPGHIKRDYCDWCVRILAGKEKKENKDGSLQRKRGRPRKVQPDV